MNVQTKSKNKLLQKIISLVISAVLVLSAFLPVTLSPMSAHAVTRSISLENSYEDNLTSTAASNQYYFEITSPGSILIKFETSTVTKTNSWRVNLINVTDSISYSVKDFGSGDAPSNAPYRTEYSDRMRLPKGRYFVSVSVPDGYAVVATTYKISVNFIPETDGTYEIEPNNMPATATPLIPNTSMSGNISYKGDVDYFKFPLPSPGSLTISFSVASSIETGNWVVLLYDKNEKQLQMGRVGLGGEVSGLTRTNKFDTVRLPAGDYYIKVIAYSDTLSSGADYKISTAYTPERSVKYEKEFNDAQETANNLLINAPITGNMGNIEDRDYFKFTVAEYRNLRIEFTTPDTINQNMWTIYLQDSKGGVATYYAGQGGATANGKRIFKSDILNFDRGIYYIVIFPYGSTANSYSNADYTLAILSDSAPIPPINDEDDIEYPTEVPYFAYNVNKNFDGSLKNANDSNIFEFGLNYNGSVSVDFISPQSITKELWTVNIYDKNDKLLASGKYGDAGQFLTGSLNGMKIKTSDKIRLPAGSYYVKVLPINSYDYSPALYGIKINYSPEAREALNSKIDLYETEFNNTPLTANNLTLGEPLMGNLSDFNDTDYFKFTLTKNSGVKISFTSPVEITQNDWTADIFTNDFKSQAIFTEHYGSEGTVSGAYSDYKTAVSKILRLPPGIYYLRVGAYNIINYSNEDYKINVEVAEDHSGSGALYETEFNDIPATANILPLNTDMIGNIFHLNDVDYFKISVGSEKEIQIKFSISFQINASLWSIKLFDASQKELKSYKIGEGGVLSSNGFKYFKTEKILLIPGDYYVCISSYTKNDFSNEDYIFKVIDDIGQKIDTYVFDGDKPSNWAINEVMLAYAYNLAPQGYMKNFTSPIKREEFSLLAIKLLEVAENKPIAEILADKNKEINYYAFTDTADIYILSANALGIVNGRGNGIFDPGGNITREEAATMLMRLGILENINLNVSPLFFSDASKFNTWSVDAIAYVSGCMDMRSNRVMNGYADGQFHPKDTYSREQAFMTIFRLFSIKTGV